MPRFFVDPIVGGDAFLDGEDARHVAKVLRMRPGEALTLCDGQGWDYHCTIAAVASDHVSLAVEEKVPSESEPSIRIQLYQALPKGDKLEMIVQKAVELGVAEITPVLTERCVSRPDAKGMAKKIQRLQKVAHEAAKQSGRGIVPQIRPLLSFGEAISGMKSAGRAIVLYERATTPLSACLAALPAELAVLVGSEGGFSAEEAARAEAAGVATASLGKRILRCETAPLCALSAILYAAGEF